MLIYEERALSPRAAESAAGEFPAQGVLPKTHNNIMSEEIDKPTVPADDESAAMQMNTTAADEASATGSSAISEPAVAPAAANLNNKTNNNTTMNNNTDNTTAGAPVSEGVSPDFSFTASVSPIGFTRTTFAAPQLSGSDWDTVYSGVCVDLMNQAAVTNQLVLKGDKLVLTRPSQLSVCMTVDDHGDLLISNSELADDAIQAAFDAAQKLSSNEAIITAFTGSLCFHMDLQGTEWQDFDSGAAAWKRPVRTLVLPAGEYFIYGRVTNDPMKGGNANNRKQIGRAHV